MIDVQYVNVDDLKLNYIEDWFSKICQKENKILSPITIIIGTDDWLLKYNQTYLDHNYYTDIITFDYCENDFISGDLLISLDRIIENAHKFNVSRETELNRVCVHGLLHLIGYDDKSKSDLDLMRKKEEEYLKLINN